MTFEENKIEEGLNQSFFEKMLVRLQELKRIGGELSPEFEAARQEAIGKIDRLFGGFLGMIDMELVEDGESFEILSKMAAVAEFLNDAEILERIRNLQEIYE